MLSRFIKNDVDYVRYARGISADEYIERLETENAALRKKKRPHFLMDLRVYKTGFATLLFGGLVWNMILMSLLPQPLKETYQAWNNFQSQALFNLKCDFRKK
jgi:hypothetical protein